MFKVFLAVAGLENVSLQFEQFESILKTLPTKTTRGTFSYQVYIKFKGGSSDILVWFAMKSSLKGVVILHVINPSYESYSMIFHDIIPKISKISITKSNSTLMDLPNSTKY